MGRRGGFFAAIARAAREQERAERRRMRDAASAMRAAQRLDAAARRAQEQYLAQLAVEEYEGTIAALTSVHRESSPPINWQALLYHQASVDRTESTRLQHEIAAHRGTLLERMMGSNRGRDRLIAALHEAIAREDAAYREAEIEAQQTRHTAAAVLAGDTNAYNFVVENTECLGELAELGCRPVGRWIDTQTAWTTLVVGGPEIVPSEARALTAAGKLSSKKIPASRQMEIYQDFVCGVALRVARELCAVLPLRGVLCDVRAPVLDPRTGHAPEAVVLSVFCPADRIATGRINFATVDASDLVSTFRHAMRLQKGKGFSPVEPLPPHQHELQQG